MDDELEFIGDFDMDDIKPKQVEVTFNDDVVLFDLSKYLGRDDVIKAHPEYENHEYIGIQMVSTESGHIMCHVLIKRNKGQIEQS